ncbi:Uncharacterized protein TCM_031559 [Theobroma cacao]|uniref:Uncharacterized protein n=1 Tax=Theobroma cacao TaxID=3641 RepID=A0A061F7M6_THECC|nr:Uncharacterized protein TCM_031559 [Theobroma cacao]
MKMGREDIRVCEIWRSHGSKKGRGSVERVMASRSKHMVNLAKYGGREENQSKTTSKWWEYGEKERGKNRKKETYAQVQNVGGGLVRVEDTLDCNNLVVAIMVVETENENKIEEVIELQVGERSYKGWEEYRETKESKASMEREERKNERLGNRKGMEEEDDDVEISEEIDDIGVVDNEISTENALLEIEKEREKEGNLNFKSKKDGSACKGIEKEGQWHGEEGMLQVTELETASNSRELSLAKRRMGEGEMDYEKKKKMKRRWVVKNMELEGKACNKKGRIKMREIRKWVKMKKDGGLRKGSLA